MDAHPCSLSSISVTYPRRLVVQLARLGMPCGTTVNILFSVTSYLNLHNATSFFIVDVFLLLSKVNVL